MDVERSEVVQKASVVTAVLVVLEAVERMAQTVVRKGQRSMNASVDMLTAGTLATWVLALITRVRELERLQRTNDGHKVWHAAAQETIRERGERAEKAEAEVERLRALLSEVVGYFTEKGYPGEACLRTGWIRVGTVDEWRAALDGGTPVPSEEEA